MVARSEFIYNSNDIQRYLNLQRISRKNVFLAILQLHAARDTARANNDMLLLNEENTLTDCWI